MGLRSCCIVLCLLIAAVAAEPIVLKTVRHVNAHPSIAKRDSEPETYNENLVNDLETYAVEIGLGSPAKTYRLVVDTASADLFVYSPDCPKKNCPGPSSTSSAVSQCGSPLTCPTCRKSDNACMFSQTYGDGATCSGRVVKDKVSFDELSTTTYYGLIDAATGGPGKPAFFTNSSISGIFGLLPTASTSNFNAKSPIISLMEANRLPNGMTLCLRPAGGALILGEDFDHTRANYEWTKLTSRTLYTIKINDIGLPRQGVSGGLLGFSDGAAILDSATTNIVFPSSAESKIKDAFQALCNRLKMKGLCDSSPSVWSNYVQLSSEERIKYPNLVFYIDGLERALSVSPNQYMTEFNGYYTMNIDFSGTKTILGNGFLKNFRIAIDLEKKEVGFGDMRTCPGGPQPAKKTDEDTYRILVNSSFTSFKFEQSAGWRYSSLCGGSAPKTYCAEGDANCASAGATKPLWVEECDWNSALGKGIEVEARWGQTVDRDLGQSVIGTRDIAMPATLPIDKPFLFSTVKFWNTPVKAGTAPCQVTMRTTVDFTTPHRIDTYAAFSFDVVFNITNYGTCANKGCPWNDPTSWPNHLVNKKCKNGKLPDGTACCPYWTTRNADNQCASSVELASLYDNNMRAAELNGELYKIFFIGFHEDSSEHRSDRRLYEFFSADVGAITAANLHARLIPLCPACPPGTKQEVHADGSCTCQCKTSCDLPTVSEPDCSCIERISHDAQCNYFCDSEDYARVPCQGGVLYVTDGNYRGETLPPSPPGCDPYSGSYDYYYDPYYYGYDSSYGSCGYYNDMYCECVCSAGCPNGGIQNADCTCSCPACPANKYEAEGCACLCRDGCPAGQAQNPDSCGCSCPSGCPGNKVQNGDCSCSCASGCPGGQVQNPDSCDCSCPNGCPAGQVQAGDCSCSCPSGCPGHKVQGGDCGCVCPSGCEGGLVQDSDSCACNCGSGCPAGKVQNGDCSCSCPSGCPTTKSQAEDCSCHCTATCPAGKVQDADSCGCSCASGCPGGMTQDPDTCACSCPSGCPAGMAQDPNTCACACPNACPAGMTRDASGCGCHCASGCPAGQVQDPNTCGCSCPNDCDSVHVQNTDCTCSCPSGCPAGRVQDPSSCHCQCPNTCTGPRIKLNTDDCSCECPNSCSAPHTQDAGCACVCPNECAAGMILNYETCACEATCDLMCAATKTLNVAACRCECSTGCPVGKVQDPDSCACSCASTCPTSKVQDPSSCGCSCPFACPAGQVQDPASCQCSCDTSCPAGMVRNTDDCGCHCASACSGAASAQDPNTCACSCPSECPEGKVQDPTSCACSCPGSCPAGHVRNADGCGCHCAESCPAGKTQDPNTCACSCPTTCPTGQVQDPTSCECSCPNTCPRGKVQSPEDCSCYCATGCSGAKSLQDVETCECSCPNTCPAGQTQDAKTCECNCPNKCPAGQVRNEDDCGCHCGAACIGAADVQDPDTCTCSCPSKCSNGRTQNPQTCECSCPAKCPAGQVRNDDNCGCHCPNTCKAPQTSMNPETCECSCPPVRCMTNFVADPVNCGCTCALECPAGKKLQKENCACECAKSCPATKSLDKDSCECFCKKSCPAGQVQDPETCDCSCPNECPAGKLRNDNDCGCHCAGACSGSKSVQNAETCECSCPNTCNVPFAQLPDTCVCACPNTCAAPLELNAGNCQCSCPNTCPEGRVQNNVDCTCSCAAVCEEDELLDEPTCICVAKAEKKQNKAAIIGGAVAGAVAFAMLAAAAVYLIRSRISKPDNYQALTSDDSGFTSMVSNPAFQESGLTVVNPAFRVD